MREIGVNTWVWASPLTDANVTDLLRKVAAMGFDAVELPLENPGDFSAGVVPAALAETRLTPYVVGAMAPGGTWSTPIHAPSRALSTTSGRASPWPPTSGPGRCAGPSTPPPVASGGWTTRPASPPTVSCARRSRRWWRRRRTAV